MKSILSIITACIMLVVVAASVSADKRIPAYRNPIYVPSPPQSLALTCSTQDRIATIDYWPLDSDAHYTALFEASGSGYIFLSTDTETRASLTLHNASPAWHTLDLTPPEGSGGTIQLRMGAEASTCAAKGNTGLVVRSLNIFVTP